MILFTADWQCSATNLDRCQLVLDQLLAYLDASRVSEKAVVHAGDFKDQHNPVDQRVTNFIIRAVQQIKQRARFYFVRGNHDSIAARDGVPSCCDVVVSAGADGVADESWLLVPCGKKTRLHLVPYFRDPDRQRAEFRAAAEYARRHADRCNVLVFHNEVAGCLMNLAGLRGRTYSLADLGAYSMCIGGHIHMPQRDVQNRVAYVGSPFCVDWGECNQEKQAFVELRDGVIARAVLSVVPGWYDPGAPGFPEGKKDWKGCRVRVRVPVRKDPAKEIATAKTAAEKKYAGAVVTVVPEFTRADQPTALDLRKDGDEALLREYVSKLSLPEFIHPDQIITYLRGVLPRGGALGVQPLRFLRAEARNVLCFENVCLEMHEPGVTLVTGCNLDWAGDGDVSNGSGKSSLVSLPFLPLFGRTFKGQQHDAWARRGQRARATCAVVLQLADGRELRVERSRRPSEFRVMVGGREVTLGDPNATQARLEQLTNLTWSVLTNAVYIGQREIGSVFGTDKDRKELFSRLLGLDRFLDAQTAMRKAVGKAQRAVDDADGELTTASALLADARRARDEKRAALEALPSVPKPDAAARKRLEIRIRRAEKENAAKEPWLAENQKMFEEHLFRATDAEATAREVRRQIHDREPLATQRQCPTCGRRVDTMDLRRALLDLETRYDALDATCKKHEAAMQSNRLLRKTVLEVVSKNVAEIANCQRALAEMDRTDAAAKEAETRRDAARAEVDAAVVKVRQRERVLRIHEAAREACVENLRFTETCAAVVGRDGLPAYLCAVIVPQLNTAALRYSWAFARGEIGVEFRADGGDIDVAVSNAHGGENTRDQSMGEMRMAALVAAFAFRDVLVPHNVLILDEPGEGLDAANAAAFARGLLEVADRFGSVYAISHNPAIVDGLEGVRQLRVVKRDGVSEVICERS